MSFSEHLQEVEADGGRSNLLSIIPVFAAIRVTITINSKALLGAYLNLEGKVLIKFR